ncbi:hypothetical protein Tco_1310922 [Tanacetum coccineum]
MIARGAPNLAEENFQKFANYSASLVEERLRFEPIMDKIFPTATRIDLFHREERIIDVSYGFSTSGQDDRDCEVLGCL